MVQTVTMNIKNFDFSFENSPARIVANRKCPEIKIAGLTVGPFEEGTEYEVKHWIAQQLEKSGIARLHQEERLNASKLFKIQWKERVQTARQISKLPEEFYPKFRRYIAEMREVMVREPEKVREYEKVTQLTHDIINSRLKKIVSLASAPAQTGQVLNNLTNEERFLYEQLYGLINEWRTEIFKNEGAEK